VVPGHPVIGASGKLTAMVAGCGRKHWLLEHRPRYAVLAACVRAWFELFWRA